MTKVAIIGAAGYTGGELIRVIKDHPNISEFFAISESNGGKRISSVHEDVLDLDGKVFDDKFNPKNVDVVFLCGGHGDSNNLMKKHGLNINEVRIIDLSQDFRHKENSNGFIYGLSEVFRSEIITAKAVANPGCFATAIQLSLAPLAKLKKLNPDIHITAITGSTGAGQKPQATTHYSWRSNNISVYKPFEHQHLKEINETLSTLSNGDIGKMLFVPVRGPFTRGIISSIHLKIEDGLDFINSYYKEFYKGCKFVHVTDSEVHLKQVINTNNAVMSIRKHDEYVHITCCIDNLLKGASGQAVQNMNLMLGLEENAGLNLKSVYF